MCQSQYPKKSCEEGLKDIERRRNGKEIRRLTGECNGECREECDGRIRKRIRIK
ncbi:hypothetical protein Glove_64g66 [Diversispora epigaea]|uniref:Uncharacterized protein n=1 Tax=Diversispora epigaea TaxID=1348612 RepID=A0A397JEM1_9GLOM|nr:hypothetical protein Glove_64g66 [Diversispora epigaea]